MLELKVKTVEPYKIEQFEDEEFKHHYVHGDKTYTAGAFLMNHSQVSMEKYPDLKAYWLEFDTFVNDRFPEIQKEFDDLDAAIETFRLRERKKTDGVIRSVEKNRDDARAYYILRHAAVAEARFNWVKAKIAQELEFMQTMQFSIICEIQCMLRTNLPINLVQMEDTAGFKTSFAYVWHCPQQRDENGKGIDAPEFCNPDSMRDYRNQLQQIVVAKQGEAAWQKLDMKHPMKRKMVKTFNELDQQIAELSTGKKPGNLIQMP